MDTCDVECGYCETVRLEELLGIGTATSSTDVYKYVNHVIMCARMYV